MSEAPAETVTPEPATPPPSETPPETPPAEPETDLAAEVEKWKAQSRKNEDRAKANAEAAKELERLKREAMPEQERLIEEARAAARAEALAEVGTSRVDDAVKLAAAGRPVDVDALLEGLDRTRFLGEGGQPNAPAIAAWVDRIAPAPTPEPDPQPAPSVLDFGQGARGSGSSGEDPLLADLKSALNL